MYRIRELEKLTDVPRTTIHYYVREGLLPAPEKSAPNAALYSDRHRTLLEAVRELRSGPHPAPLAVIRRALELIDKGVAPAVAVALQRSVVGDQPAIAAADYDAAQLADESGLPRPTVRRLVAAGVLLPDPETPTRFDGLDLLLARRIAELVEISGMDPLALQPFAEAIRDISRSEMELRNDLVGGADLDHAARVSAAGQALMNVWHNYLFARARRHDVVEHGLGAANDRGAHASREQGRRGGTRQDRLLARRAPDAPSPNDTEETIA